MRSVISFNEMNERIARLLEAQRQFVADASHQLRTPLTALRLRLEETEAELGTPAAGPELEAALAEVDRLSGTVDELLVLSRAGERRLEGARVDLEELASATVARWHGQARERGITLEHRPAGPAGAAWAARADLERILDALVENALNYSPAGTTVAMISAPGQVEVRDHGAGIDEDERDLVFARFRRGRAGRQGPPGSGLGLSMAQELARAWGATLAIRPNEGGGTIVRLALPGLPEPARADQPAAALPAVNSPARSVPGP
jgi:signal transduction histidine kinase